MATYTVKPDDNLTVIGQMFGVPPVEIARANNLSDPNKIEVDQVLYIPEPKGAGQPAPPPQRMGEGNIVVADLLNDPEAGAAWGKQFDPTALEIQDAERQQVDQAQIGRQIESTGADTLIPMDGEAGPSIIPKEGQPTGYEAGTVSGAPGVQTTGAAEAIFTGKEQVAREQPDLLAPDEAAPAIPQAAAVVEPEVPAPTEEIPVDEAKTVVAPPVAPALDAYRQYVSDLMGTAPKDVTITRNEIRQLENRITGYNDRIQAIAEEKAKPFFGKEDTGRMFLAAIAAGLGAYAAAMTGTRNFALDTINQAIERDLQAQRESKDFRVRDLEQQRLLLLERRGELVQFARDQVASNVALAQNQGMAQLNLAKLNQTQQQLEQQLAKIQADYQQALAKVLVDVRNQYLEGYVPGLGYTPLRGEGQKIAIKAANEFQTAENDMKPLIEEALMLIEENSAAIKIPGSDERARMQQLLDQVRLTYKNNVAKIGAAATASEMQEFLNGIVPNFRAGATLGEAVFGTVKVKLNGILKDLEQKRRNIIKQYQFSEGNQSAAGSAAQPEIPGLTPGTSKQ